MNINLGELDNVTRTKYNEFKERVAELLKYYQQTDGERFNLVKKKIEQTNGNWDTTINLISNDSIESINISLLLAYEYCLASEKITSGKVSFESMLEKLFNGVQKFRIGNPVPGEDDECLYGKSLNDPTAIPITLKLYRMVMPAGAQHLEYFKDGSFVGAVFIYEKGIIKNFAKDENGNPVDMKTDGIDFHNLSQRQSLLTNLRQTVFHEWTHNSEKDIIEPAEDTIAYEYQSENGKTYRNYEIINSYVTLENTGNIQEPQYIISTQKDSNGNRKKYFQDKNGNPRPLSEVTFGLEEKQLETDYCFSTGLTTRELLPNGKNRIHNIITEGFVERTARTMIRAIDPQVTDIDEGRYLEYVEIAKRVIESRDISLGKDGQGQTYADFLMHSSVLKMDLESRTVILDDGSKTDGLHYISDYADRVQNHQTRKAQFFAYMPNIVKKLRLSRTQIDMVRESIFWQKPELTQDEQDYLKALLVGGNPIRQQIVNIVIAEFVDILREENEFFNGIAEKLGYTAKNIDSKKSVQGVTDSTISDEMER